MNIFKRPMFWAAIVCSVSAALSLFVAPLSFMFTAASIVLLVFITIYYKKYQYITVVLAIILFTVSLIAEFIKIDELKQREKQRIAGTFLVAEDTVDHGEFNIVTLKEYHCSDIPQNTKLLLFDYDKTNLQMGDIVSATLKISVVDKYDKYRISNYSDGIYATANVIKIKKSNDYNYFYKFAGDLRSYVKETVSSRFNGDTAGLLVALTTGDKTLISDKFAGNIKTTGISHVVVVSGMHLAIIMMAVFWCLDRFFYNKYIRCIVSVLSVILISAVCGFTMSITRAGAMFIVAGLAPFFSRDNDSISSLLTAVTAVLISAPFAIFNISFQLSVLSTLAIIWVVPFYSKLIKERFNIKSKILNVLIDTFLCSVSAIIFTLPVTIKIFGYVSVVSPITNFIISYPVMFALIFNIVALIISVIPFIKFLSTPLFFIAGLCSRFIVFIVNKIAQLPITVAVLPQYYFWFAIIVILIVILFMYFYELKKKRSDLNANSV